MKVKLEDFVPDAAAKIDRSPVTEEFTIIDGLKVRRLRTNADDRGSLTEMLSQVHGPHDPIVHVYQVVATAGSVRAWVYHSRQTDRLAFCNGSFRVIAIDLRPDSKTSGAMLEIELGEDNPGLLIIPPFVAHGVQNIGGAPALFVNLPTKVYDAENPDKFRLPWNDPRIPYRFRTGKD